MAILTGRAGRRRTSVALALGYEVAVLTL